MQTETNNEVVTEEVVGRQNDRRGLVPRRRWGSRK